ncbi:MAG: hypothetical protein WC390_08710 [Sulfurimonas sp.]|jgi:hypothetical protein
MKQVILEFHPASDKPPKFTEVLVVVQPAHVFIGYRVANGEWKDKARYWSTLCNVKAWAYLPKATEIIGE